MLSFSANALGDTDDKDFSEISHSERSYETNSTSHALYWLRLGWLSAQHCTVPTLVRVCKSCVRKAIVNYRDTWKSRLLAATCTFLDTKSTLVGKAAVWVVLSGHSVVSSSLRPTDCNTQLLCPSASPGVCWSGLLGPSPGGLPDPGIKPRSPALKADSTVWATGEAPWTLCNPTDVDLGCSFY